MKLLPIRKPLLLGFLCLFLPPLIWFTHSLFIPPSEIFQTKTILIRKGTPLRTTASLLQQERIIRNRDFFIGLTILLGKKGEIKAGEYEFHTRMLPLEVLDTLVKGQVKQHLITIPEGYTIQQIAQLLEVSGIIEQRLFLEKATSPGVIGSLGLSEHFPELSGDSNQRGKLTLEGYLFPDTYHFYKEIDPEAVIRMMTQQFRRIFLPEWIERASQLGLTPREVVILASIIEKETPIPEEKPLISAVFHNRLKKKMPLQSDPTVIYGIPRFDGNLTREHLQTPSPYNTYLNAGLPPTPICNPGRDSLWAALYPASSSYLYFVSRNDGSHHFSESYEDHQRAVQKYQKRGP